MLFFTVSSDSSIVLHKPGALDAKGHIVFKHHISGTLVGIVTPAAIAKTLDVSAQVVVHSAAKLMA